MPEGWSRRLGLPAGICQHSQGMLSNWLYLKSDEELSKFCFYIYEVFVFTRDVSSADIFYF